MIQPNLTFFCELETNSLRDLFSKPEVLQCLKALNAQVSMGLLDLSEERAEVVQRLNQEGIPLTAWLLLPKEQGYWFNLDNAPQAASRYGAFKKWSAANNLSWTGIGLDIETDIRLLQQLQRARWSVVQMLINKVFDRWRFANGVQYYRSLVTQIRSDGYFVESYQIPFMLDERKASSNILQRLAGLVDLQVDREVLMLYTSFLRPHGPGILWDYGRHAGGIGIGNTGGGVQMEGFQEPAYLDWQELCRDLLLARQLCDNIYIFSLEGCVINDLLYRLPDFDWRQSPEIPHAQVQKVRSYRKTAQAVLWAFSHPFHVLGAGVGLFWLMHRLKKANQKNRAR
jgi:hypothetical protein